MTTVQIRHTQTGEIRLVDSTNLSRWTSSLTWAILDNDGDGVADPLSTGGTGSVAGISGVPGLQAALDAKATPAQIATAISNLVGGAGAAYDTLVELQGLLQADDTQFTAILTALGLKASQAAVDANTAAIALRVTDLTDATVSAASGQLAAGVTSNVAAGGSYTSPALDAAVASPPKRFAVKAPAAGTCIVTFPDASGASSAVTLLAGEVLTLRQKSTLGWGAEGGNKSLASLDSRYTTPAALAAAVAAKQTPRSALVGSRPLVVSAPGSVYGGNQNPPNSIQNHSAPVTVYIPGGDPRLFFDFTSAEVASYNDIYIHVGLVLASGAVVEVTFGGKPGALTVVPPGGMLLSDPVAGLDLAAGTYYVQTYQRSSAYVQLYANAAVGDTTLQLRALPANGIVAGKFKLVANGTGTTTESVTVTGISGTTAPYVAQLASALVSAHTGATSGTAADLFGQGFFMNTYLYSDEGAKQGGSTDLSQGTIAAIGNSTGTLAAAVAVGDTSFTSNLTNAGMTFTIDSETVTARNVIGTSAPYKYVLTSAFTAAHASGATITAALGSAQGIAPTAIVFDRHTATAPKTVIGIGDSIMQGVGFNSRQTRSWATEAFKATNPFVSLARSGESAQQFATYATSAGRRRLLSLAAAGDWVVYEYGVNDIYGNRTLAQLQADTATILSLCRTRGMKIAMTTLTPRTTSTDGWTTVANQTIVQPTTFDLVRQNYNAWVRAGAAGYCDLLVDLEAAMDSGLASGAAATGKFRADNGDAYTPDGIHPTYLAHTTVMKAAVNPALFV